MALRAQVKRSGRKRDLQRAFREPREIQGGRRPEEARSW